MELKATQDQVVTIAAALLWGGLRLHSIRAKNDSVKASWIHRLDLFPKLKAIAEFFLPAPITLMANANCSARYFPQSHIWLSVLNSWYTIREGLKVVQGDKGRETIIWFNKDILIAGQPACFQNWIEKGIWFVDQLWDAETKTAISFDAFANTLKVNDTFLAFGSIITSVPRGMWLECDSDVMDFCKEAPFPQYSSVSGLYWDHPEVNDSCALSILKSWQNDGLLQDLSLEEWETRLDETLRGTPSAGAKLFQYRLNTRRTLTNRKLTMYKIMDSSRCAFCSEVETLIHLFWECERTQQLWQIVKDFLSWSEMVIELEPEVCLFANYKGKWGKTKNRILLLTKMFVYNNRNELRHSTGFVATEFIDFLEENKRREAFGSHLNNSQKSFRKTWQEMQFEFEML